MKLLLSAMAVVAAAGFSVRLVLNMSKCYGDNVCHMLIIETVEYIFAFSARFNQSFVFQQLKLMRDGGLCHFYLFGNIVYADFSGSDSAQDLHSRFIPHHLKKGSGFWNQFIGKAVHNLFTPFVVKLHFVVRHHASSRCPQNVGGCCHFVSKSF